MTKLKKPLLFAVFLVPIAIVAGIFTGIYQLDTYSDEIISEVVAQLGSAEILVIISTVQTVWYALFCGFFGYILADKLGLWKPIKFEKNKVILTLIISAIGGILLSLDYWTFGNLFDGIQSATVSGMTVSGIIAAGHLPATISMFGQLTPLIVFRCFLLNGGFGMLFGSCLFRSFVSQGTNSVYWEIYI